MAQNEILLRLKGTSDFSDIQSDVAALQRHFSKLNLPKNVTKNLENNFDKLDKELQKFQEHMNSGFKTKGDVTGLEKSGQKIIQIFNTIESTIDGIDTSDLKKAFQIDTSKLDKAQQDVEDIKTEIKNKLKLQLETDNSGKKIRDFQSLLNNLYKTSKTKKLDVLRGAVESGDIQKIKEAVSELDKYGQSLEGNAANATSFNNALKQIAQAVDNVDTNEFSELNNKLVVSEQKVEELSNEINNKLNRAMQETPTYVGSVSDAFKKLGGEIELNAKNQQQFNNEMAQVKDQVAHFFSLINVAQLLRRAFQDVYNTVKELDAVMTETAVVTDFSIGDMWDKLPEYTAEAKALGVATKDLYAATTLYYQQGLDTNASMAAGVETMKMARIAGMEATQATDAMTAALRGFNMEVNETNAQNVNDVYSKLAAITASDTEEIATAMSKTAAIANSVGAEFENIAVFLAQGIETTRESADAIGTAMKTILARFNEMKKDPSEIGEIDGEIVDANKVETALRSVGIALRDTNGEFRNADQVLLEVAQKWDSMSVMQQRYIATTAAGSRQQSRFIAFMQDYNRTMELQTAAYNAEGAAQQQYEKTLESLDAKMAKLKDTWDEFILGIADSDIIKDAVDFLSELLDNINKMTNAPGILGGVLKSLTAFGVFKGGKALFGGGGIFDRFLSAKAAAKKAAEAGNSASKAFKETFSKKNDSEKETSPIGNFTKDLSKNSRGVAEATKKVKEYDGAIRAAEKSNGHYINTLLEGSEYEQEQAEKALEFAEGRKQIAKQSMDAALKNIGIQELNEQQMETMQKLVVQDIGLIEAKTIVSSDAARNYVEEAIAKNQLNDETRESIQLTALEIAGKEAANKQSKKNTVQNWAEKTGKNLDNTTEKVTNFTDKLNNFTKNADGKGIKQLGSFLKGEFKNSLKQTSGALGKTFQSFKNLGSAGLKAGKAIIGAMGPAAPIVAGVTAAVVAGIAAWKIYDKYFSLEARMEKAAESTEMAEQAVESATSKYNDLLSKKEGYTELQSILDNLTKGTDEWTKKLIEVNNQVLELIKTYPKLAQYVQEGASGQLEISAEGWDSYIEESKQAIQNSQVGLAISRVNQENLKIESYQNDLDTKNLLRNVESTVDEHGQEVMITEELFSRFEAQGIANFLNPNTDAFKSAAEDFGITEKNLQEIVNDYAELNSSLEASKLAIEGYQTTMKSILADSVNIPEQYKKAFSEGFADVIITDKALREESSRLRTGHKSNSGAAKELIAMGYTSTGDQEKDLVKLMEVVSGMTQDEIIKQFSSDGIDINKINDTKLAEAIAKYTISGQASKKIEEAFDKFSKLTSQQKETFSSLMSSEGEDLDQEEINTINEAGGVRNYLIELSTKLGYGDVESFADAYNFDSFNDMVSQYAANLKDATNQITEAIEKIDAITNLGEDENGNTYGKRLNNYLSSGTISTFSDKFDQTTINNSESAQTATDAFLTQYEDMIEGMDPKTAEDFAQAVNSIDWSDSNAIKELPLFLKDLKISVPSDELDTFINLMLDATRAVSQYNAEDLAKIVSSAISSIQEMKKVAKEDKREVSEDLYNQIISQLPDYKDSFVKNLDGNFVLVNGTMESLITAIQANTEALLKETTKIMENKVNAGQWASDLIKKYNKESSSEFTDEGNWDESTGEGSGKRGYLGAFIKNAQKKGIDINSLGIEGLSADTNANSVKSDVLDKILEGIDGFITNLDSNTSELLQAKMDTLTSQYQLNSGSDNAAIYSSSEEGSIEKYSAERAMSVQAATYGIDSSVIGQYQTGMQSTDTEAVKNAVNEFGQLIDVYKDAAEIWDISSNELDDLTESLMTSEEGLEGNRVAATQMAQRLINLNKGATTICDNWEDWSKLLKNGATEQGKATRGTVEYSQAMSEARKATQQMLNMTEELPASFFQSAENLTLIEQAANGSNEALQKLGFAAADAMMQTYIASADTANISEHFEGGIEELKSEWSSVLDYFRNNPLNPGENLNDASFIDKLNKMILATGMTRDQVTELLGGMGMDTTFTEGTETVTHNVPYTVMKRTNHYDDKDNLVGYEERISTEYESVTEEVPLSTIETISGSYSSGGNINYSGGGSGGGGGGSGGGGGGSSKVYESDHDKHYNTTQKIDKKQDDRSVLQEELNELLEDEDSTLEDIQAKQEEIIKNLEEERDLQKTLAEGRLAQIREEQTNNADLTQYAWFDEELGRVQKNWDLINQVTDSEKGERIDEYIGNLEKYADGYNEAIEAGRDINKEIAEYTEAGRIELDKSFNTLEKVEKSADHLKRIEEEINSLLSSTVLDGEKLSEAYGKQIEELQEQKKLWEEILIQRQSQYDSLLNSKAGQSYLNSGFVQEVEEGVFEINWDLLGKENQDTIDSVVNFTERANEASEKLNEATESVAEFDQQLRDTFKDHLDKATSLIQDVRNALVESYQKQIDGLSQANEAIIDSQSQVIDSIQKSLDEQRQARENQKTETEISDKEARLAYLQADTTGANDLEIKNLQKELDEQKEDYTDQLIDQKINALQQQNDEAAAQRERQIELAQSQLDNYVSSGRINAEIEELLRTGVAANGEVIEGSNLYTLLSNSADYTGMSKVEQEAYWNDFKSNIASWQQIIKGIPLNISHGVGAIISSDQVISGLLSGAIAGVGLTPEQKQTLLTAISNGESEESITELLKTWGVDEKLGGLVNLISKLSNALTGYSFEVDKDGNITVTNPSGTGTGTLTGIRYDATTGNFVTTGEELGMTTSSNFKAQDARMVLRYGAQLETDESMKKYFEDERGFKDWRSVADINDDGKINATDARTLLRISARVEGLSDEGFDALFNFVASSKDMSNEDFASVLKAMGLQYKTGGLADFTGPAWLDGSKAHPELVLNSRDTQNFIQLKDILSSVMKNIGSKKSDEKIGDVYYEIHIDVEKLTSDYDVDDVANRVKTIISQDAMYRNTNIINRLR